MSGGPGDIPPQMDSLVLLGAYRQKDKEVKNVEREIDSSKQTLNWRYVQNFMAREGVTAQNFDKHFNLDMALRLVSAPPTSDHKQTGGEKEMAKVLSDAKKYLDKNNLPDLFNGPTDEAIFSNIHSELDDRKDTKKEYAMQHAYLTYKTVREYCSRSLQVQEEASNRRELEKKGLGTNIKEDVAGVLKGAKENYGNMSSGEKLAVVGGLIIAFAWMSTSDNPRMKEFGEGLWTVAKIGGGLALVNLLCKVGTGRTGLDAVDDWTSSTVASESFWTKNFRDEPERIAILRKSNVYLGDKDFLDLADRYRHAKAKGLKKIDLAFMNNKDMTPEQVYIAMEVFDHEYKIDVLEKRYRRSNPKASWGEVVATSLVEDGKLELASSLPGRVADQVSSAWTRSWNWLGGKAGDAYDYIDTGKFGAAMAAGGETLGKGTEKVLTGAGDGLSAVGTGLSKGVVGFEKGFGKGAGAVAAGALEGTGTFFYEVGSPIYALFKDLYEKSFGKADSDDEVKAWIKETFSNKISDSKDLDKFIREHNADPDRAAGYINVLQNGTPDAADSSVTVFKDSSKEGGTYIFADTTPVALASNDPKEIQKAAEAAIKSSTEKAKAFFEREYKAPKGSLDKFIDIDPSLLIVGGKTYNTYRIMAHMPNPGSKEYALKLNGKWGKEATKERKNVVSFTPTTKIEFGKDILSQEADKKQFRLRYLLTDGQTQEIAAVCEFLTRKFQTAPAKADGTRPTIDEVRKAILTDDTLRDEVFAAIASNAIQLPGNRKFETKLMPLAPAMEEKIADLEEDISEDLDDSAAEEQKLANDFRKSQGWNIRLALAGDLDAQREVEYTPAARKEDEQKDRIDTPAKLIATYKKFMKDQVERLNDR